MAIQLPYQLDIKLTITPYSGGVPVEIPFTTSGNYTIKSDDKYELIGAMTRAIDFAGITLGAKIMLVFYEAGTAPVMLDLGTDQVELKPGGGHLIWNPSPVAGTTAADLVSTANATVRTYVLGLWTLR